MIPFTQYLRPDGRPCAAGVESSPEIEDKARRLIRDGAVFTAEIVPGPLVYLSCEHPALPEEEMVLASALVPNGPEIEKAVVGLVLDATERFYREERKGRRGNEGESRGP